MVILRVVTVTVTGNYSYGHLFIFSSVAALVGGRVKPRRSKRSWNRW